MRRLVPFAVLAAAALAVSACAPQEAPAVAPSSSGSASPCGPDKLQTLEPGTLTIATDPTAYQPWMVANDPTNQQGFEAAVAYAVADQLGYAASDIAWIRVPFNAALQPGNRPFDFDINQFAITDERRQNVDFSSPYYTVPQAVITRAGSPADGAKSIDELRGLRLGAQDGTKSLDVLTDVVQPDTDPVVFDSVDEATRALEAGQVDALVVDFPAAFSITSAQMTDGVVVGQIADSGDPGDQFGLLLQKGSPITTCVSQAVDALRDDGTLADLEKRWLADVTRTPVLS